MGNTSSCCFSKANTNPTLTAEDGSQSMLPSHCNQARDTLESLSAFSIQSIQKIILEENTTEHIDELISFLDDVVSKIKVLPLTISAMDYDSSVSLPSVIRFLNCGFRREKQSYQPLPAWNI